MPYTIFGNAYYGVDSINAGYGGDGILQLLNGSRTVDGVNVASFNAVSQSNVGVLRATNFDLTITNGTAGEFVDISVGRNGGGNNAITNNGVLIVEDGSQFNVTLNPILGSDYGGANAVQSQGTYSGLTIGQDGGTGSVLVTGDAGDASRISIQGDGNRITVGRNEGTGTLTIEDAGIVEGRSLQIARDNSTGTVRLSGDQATGTPLLHLSNQFGSSAYASGPYSGDGQYFDVGRGDNGTGNLIAEGSAHILFENLEGYRSSSGGAAMRIGRDDNSVGNVRLQGSDVVLDIIKNGDRTDGFYGAALAVGRNGEGHMTVEDGATLNILGADAFLNVGRRNATGEEQGFTSTLDILSGGVVNVSGTAPGGDDFGGGSVAIGRSGAKGALTISGAGSQFNVTVDDPDGDQAPFFIVGREGGTGQLTISNGGALNLSANPGSGGGGALLQVGRDAGSTGDLVVTSGSEINIDFNVADGQSGYGGIAVGREGDGTMKVNGGSQISIDGNDGNYAFLRAGRGSEGSGVIKINGEGTALDITSTNEVGPFTGGFITVARDDGSYGRLDILNGADVTMSNARTGTFVAGPSGATGKINVLGAGSTFDAGDFLFLATSVDSAQVDANGALLESAIDGTVQGGNARLKLAGGGTLTADEVVVGRTALFDVEGTVTGNLTSFGEVQIGSDMISSVTITGDAEIARDSELEFDLDSTGQTDLLQVDGALDLFIEGVVKIDVIDGLNIESGTEFVLAEATGGITIDPISGSLTVFTDVPTQAFSLEVRGTQLVATARQPGDLQPLLIGNDNDNTLTGTHGDDTINGNGGDDSISGLDGNDILIGGSGADDLDGGDGIDTASYETATSRVQADLGNVVVGIGDAAGDTFQFVENLIGTIRNDVLRGNSGDNEIRGGNASDRLFGLAGNDTLLGESGTDVLIGNAGADTMTGDVGNDRFIYFNLNDSRVGSGLRDVITDFDVSGNDRIEISRFDADTNVGGNQAFTFIGLTAFSNTAGELRADQSSGTTTVVQGDVDGDGAADFEIELTGLITLDATDFLL